MPKFVPIQSVKSVLFWSVISAAFIGPGTITTCAMSGATFGLDLLWTLTFAIIACTILQETVARITIASGYSLGEVIAMSYPTMKYLIGFAIVFGCAAYQAGNILGAVAGLQLIFTFDKVFMTLLVAFFASLTLALGKDKSIAKFMGIWVALMGLMFIFVATQATFSFSQVVKSVLIPFFPSNSALLIIGLVGTTIVPYNLFLGSGISKGQDIKEMRIGIRLAILIGGLISMAILVSGSIVKGEFSFVATVNSLNERIGVWAGGCFAVGLFAAGFTSSITAPLAATITMRSIVYTGHKNWAKYSSWTWVLVMVVGIIFGVLGTQPIPIILFAQALNGLLLPLVSIWVFLIINNQKIIPHPYQNSKQANFTLLIVIGIVIFLGLNNLQKAILTHLPFAVHPTFILLFIGILSLSAVIILWALGGKK
ncbi:NRAMP family divalent metal transporter [Thermoflexibacter ruber]|uniref:NRAMP (Natural resistance-associated macrophage protein) metal ion transporters n=1 Tax=Thermoflexibacter ruber TaxID=1003 RepID=A0A1I2IYV4_9BACT|nr:divalent metal cation transporter [Thermoflexibacter ruber]SFF46898.1 NRAMP (natural resistance-associated macrophage protein) metal ion transporters [Thermoflexibacter ruber]